MYKRQVEAQAALEQGDVRPVLKWVSKSDEDQIKSVFESVQQVRTQSREAKAVADRYFLETLIRIHRASEGAPYTGLKPAGTVEPAIAAADHAITEGSADILAARLGAAAEKAVKERFAKLKEAQARKDNSVEAGRDYVAAYVEYIHFVEGLHEMISGKTAAHEHAAESENAESIENTDH